MRWNQIRVGIEMPYPLDSETAAAWEAAQQHHVLTWEVLEEGDELANWVLESFVAEGKTPLPEGAYLMRSGIYSRIQRAFKSSSMARTTFTVWRMCLTSNMTHTMRQ